MGTGRRRSRGEGTVFRRSRDGRWVARADLGWYDGKRDRREFTGATAAEARERRDAFLALRRDGFTVPRGKPATVATWMAHWIANVAPARVEATTIDRSYRQRVEDLIIPYLGMIRLAELTEEDIEAWHASLARRRSRKGGYLSASTITTAHRVLGRALKDAVVRGKMPRNPCSNVSPPRIRRAEIQAPSSAEAAAILAACEEWPNGARWVLAISTGLRQGEALGLRWLDVKLDGEPSVAVRQTLTRLDGEWVFKRPKSDKSYRTVALPAVAAEALKAHRANSVRDIRNVNLVFSRPDGEPIHAKTDLNDWRALLAGLGLPPYRVHDLRHAAATALLEMGVDVRVVQEILGHSSATVTQGTYQHVREVLHRDAADRLGEWLRGGI